MKTFGSAENFLTDTDGHRIGVLLDIRTYKRLRRSKEELADIQAYDLARPRAMAQLKSGKFSALAEYRAPLFSHFMRY